MSVRRAVSVWLRRNRSGAMLDLHGAPSIFRRSRAELANSLNKINKSPPRLPWRLQRLGNTVSETPPRKHRLFGSLITERLSERRRRGTKRWCPVVGTPGRASADLVPPVPLVSGRAGGVPPRHRNRCASAARLPRGAVGRRVLALPAESLVSFAGHCGLVFSLPPSAGLRQWWFVGSRWIALMSRRTPLPERGV